MRKPEYAHSRAETAHDSRLRGSLCFNLYILVVKKVFNKTESRLDMPNAVRLRINSITYNYYVSHSFLGLESHETFATDKPFQILFKNAEV